MNDFRGLSNRARLAYRHGLDQIRAAFIGSPWGAKGGGWQEHWERARAAGFYASCDGLIVLSTTPPGIEAHADDKAIAERVYTYHLCPSLDADVPAETFQQKKMRADCLAIVMKLSKFIQVSRTVSTRIRDHRLMKIAIETVIDATCNGGWPNCLSTPVEPQLSGTCEAVVALAPLRTREVPDKVMDDAIRYLLSQLDSKDRVWRLVILWSLAEALTFRKSIRSLDFPSLLSMSLGVLEEPVDHLRDEFFPNALGQGDYYHFNASLLGAKTLLRLVGYGQLKQDHIRFAFPIVLRTTENILSNGRYTSDGSQRQARFWEHHQAMTLLAELIELAAKQPDINGVKLMYIEPKHFEKTTFVVQENLAVVLMPFKPNWSNDVFDVIKRTLEAKSFEAWRSDLSFKDDQIMQEIWEHINKARFVIADCTGRNSNVFYELGIAHTIGKPVFICAQKRADIPFDLAAIRSFQYGEPFPTQLRQLQVALEGFVNQLE